jgi:hypothetical protein
MIVIPKGYENAPADAMPSDEAIATMMEYNKTLGQAGVLLALNGLYPPAAGARVQFSDAAKPTVTDGPFAEAKETVGGFWVIQARSQEEAIEWAKRAPMAHGDLIEVRQLMGEFDHSPGAD